MKALPTEIKNDADLDLFRSNLKGFDDTTIDGSSHV
jgi:hypothetical protein